MNKPALEIEAVIFDIGGVLINLDMRRIIQRTAEFMNLPVSTVEFSIFKASTPAAFDQLDELLDFECGRIDGPAFHQRMQKVLNLEVPYEGFCRVWNSIFDTPIHQTCEVMLNLNQRPELKVGVLSNTNALHTEYMLGVLPCLKEVKHLFLSQEIGCRKPELATFELVLNRMQVKPERSIFIDDLPLNIAGAQAAGLRTIHATSAQAVAQGLAELGLLR